MSGEDLARQALACAGWMSGMRVDTGHRVLYLTEGSWLFVVDDDGGTRWMHVEDDEERPVDHAMPDLDDAATVGCLESRLFAAWPGARISIDLDPWADPERHHVPCAEVRICPAPGEPCRSFFARGPRARVEAIIAALDAAPKAGGAS